MDLESEVKKLLEKEWNSPEDEIIFVDERGDGHHYFLKITSGKFEGLNRIKRSQAVYKLLDRYLNSGKIHALRMELKTPKEINQN